jgi:hypothetical protein
MWLAETSIKRPVFATMFIAALVVLGIVSYPSIGVDLYPEDRLSHRQHLHATQGRQSRDHGH